MYLELVVMLEDFLQLLLNRNLKQMNAKNLHRGFNKKKLDSTIHWN